MPAGYCSVLAVNYYSDPQPGGDFSDGLWIPMYYNPSWDSMTEKWKLDGKFKVTFTCGAGEEPTPFCRMCVRIRVEEDLGHPNGVESWQDVTSSVGVGLESRGYNGSTYEFEGACDTDQNTVTEGFTASLLEPGKRYRFLIDFGNFVPTTTGAPSVCNVIKTREFIKVTPAAP